MAETQNFRRVVGVFPDQAHAERAVDKAIPVGGDAHSVRYADPADERRSMMTEMQEEMEASSVGPLTGALPGSARKALHLVVPAATAAGAVMALLVALIPVAGWTLPGRMVVYGLVGAACGSIVGFLIGADVGVRGSEAKMASDRGTVLGIRVAPDRAPAVADAMATEQPIRVDLTPSRGAGQAVADELGEASKGQ